MDYNVNKSNKLFFMTPRNGAGIKQVCLIATYFLLVTLLLSGSVFAQTPRLVFPDSSQVTSSRIYLSDIAYLTQPGTLTQNKMKGIMVAVAPSPGKVRVLKRRQIVRILRTRGITEKNITLDLPEKILVSRKFVFFDKNKIERLIRDELLQRNFIDEKNSEFEIYEIQKDVRLPVGKVTKRVKMPNNLRADNRFWVSFFVDGKLKNRIWARGSIKRHIDVLVANRDIKVNDKITADDLSYTTMNLLELNGDYFTNIRAVANKRAAVNISSGMLIKKRSIDSFAAVKAGDLVTIMAVMKNMTINAYGKVLTHEGSIGETVTVMNVDSKEKLQAVVVSNKIVKVEVY